VFPRKAWPGQAAPRQTDDFFNFYYNFFPDDHPFWQLVVADPGPVQMFNFPVYGRGAMTLHRLRRTVGDDAFFTILRQWTRVHCDEGRTGTTSEFIALAEMVSGMDLGDLFQAWLFTPAKPALPAAVEALRLVSPAGTTADPRFRLLRTADHVRR